MDLFNMSENDELKMVKSKLQQCEKQKASAQRSYTQKNVADELVTLIRETQQEISECAKTCSECKYTDIVFIGLYIAVGVCLILFISSLVRMKNRA